MPLKGHKPGTLLALLTKSYAALIGSAPERWEHELEKWRDYDREAFENPETVGACVFITHLDGLVIGFGSWDPRRWPETGVVGHNCILPGFRARGHGKRQIREILGRFRSAKFKKAEVSTGEHPFYIPAQRMYKACGFIETGRKAGHLGFRMIEYELVFQVRVTRGGIHPRRQTRPHLPAVIGR